MNIERLTDNPALLKAMIAGQLAVRATTEEQEDRVKELITEAEEIIGGGQDRDQVIRDIARRILHIQHLDPRNRDSLDFHDVGVRSVREALEQAYEMGRASTGDIKAEENHCMTERQEEFVAELLDICRMLESNSEGRVQLVYAEGDETQDPEMEAAHFLKLDGMRLGRDIELLGFMTELAGFGMPMSDFAQAVSIIKAKGCGEAYESVRQRCSDLEQYLEQEHRKAWRDIFSIPAKEKKDEYSSSDGAAAEEGDHPRNGDDNCRAHAEQS